MNMNTLMGIVTIFGGVGMFMNDFVAIMSVLGSSVLIISAIFFPNASPRKLDDFFYWSIGGLLMGGVFQVCLLVTGMPEQIGVIFRMPSGVVNALFILSFLLLLARIWVIKRRPPAVKPPSRRGKGGAKIVHVHVGRDMHGNIIVGDENDTKQSSK